MKEQVDKPLLEMQQKFRAYYDKHLGHKFVMLEQKRKEYLRCLIVRPLYYIFEIINVLQLNKKILL